MNINREDDLIVDLDDLTLDPAGEKPTPVAKADTPVRTPAREADIDPEVVSSLRKQIDQLQAETAAERAGRVAAEQVADKNARLAHGAAQHAQASRLQLVEGYVRQASAREGQIKDQIKSALEAGDYTAVSNLQMEAAKVASRKLQYEDTLADLEVEAKRPRAEPEPVRPSAPADQFEASIQAMSEPSKNWLRQHRECITDEVKNAEVLLADKMARRNGLQPDTDGYFKFIEERMGYRQKDEPAELTDDGVEVIDAKPEPRRSSMPAAPVSRDARPNGKPSASQYRLSKAEVEMAEQLGMSPTEYAKYKIQAEREGRYQNH
jgi:hypothetical protein